MKCYEYSPLRPEALFMIGNHYLHKGENQSAYIFLKHAFELGIPTNNNMNIKTHQYCIHLPRLLIPLCYDNKNFTLGSKVVERLLEHSTEKLYTNWRDIFYLLNINEPYKNAKKISYSKNKLIAFVSPGGWSEWDGETLRTKGIGGSETFSIRYAETLAEMGYTVIVFCNCQKSKKYNDVIYETMETYIKFISTYVIDVCILNRYHQHLPLLINNNIENIYYVLHDIAVQDDIIPYSNNIKGILCISEWHRSQFLSYFPNLNPQVISYGIDITSYPIVQKKRHSFIYSSFPNRGLYWLLKLFPRITEKYPNATLDIFCDMTNEWVLKNSAFEISEINRMILEQPNVINHGWVNIHTLNSCWTQSHIWFYPCHFSETCCLTAYQAAASRTLAISNDLGALSESVSCGVIIPGDVSTVEWQEQALKTLFDIVDTEQEYKFIARNYDWANSKAYDIVVRDFVSRFIS
jgi:hypothetical protein